MCKCWSLHHLWFFLAGAAFWEAVAHVGLQAHGLLPITVWGMTVTESSNYIVIGFALLLCLLFLFLGHRKSCSCSTSSSSKCC